jgi:hypothetical protein
MRQANENQDFSTEAIDSRWDESFSNREVFAATRSNYGVNIDYDEDIDSQRVSDACNQISNIVEKIF